MSGHVLPQQKQQPTAPAKQQLLQHAPAPAAPAVAPPQQEQPLHDVLRDGFTISKRLCVQRFHRRRHHMTATHCPHARPFSCPDLCQPVLREINRELVRHLLPPCGIVTFFAGSRSLWAAGTVVGGGQRSATPGRSLIHYRYMAGSLTVQGFLHAFVRGASSPHCSACDPLSSPSWVR